MARARNKRKPAGKKAPRRKGGKKKKSLYCERCGAHTEGKASLCFTCVAKAVTVVEKDRAKKVADVIKERLRRGDLSGPVCPFCRAELDPQTIGVQEFEITIYVREKIYYCPACRGFLGVSSWHSEG